MAKNGLRQPRHGSFIQAYAGSYRVKIIAGTKLLSHEDAKLIGRGQFTKALGTNNLAEAERKAPDAIDDIVTEIKLLIAEAKSAQPRSAIALAVANFQPLHLKAVRAAYGEKVRDEYTKVDEIAKPQGDAARGLRARNPDFFPEDTPKAKPSQPRPAITFDAVIDKWVIDRHIAEKQEADMRRVVRDLLACIRQKDPTFDGDPTRVTEQHMREFKDWMVKHGGRDGKGYSPTSIDNYRKQLRNLFNFAIEQYPDSFTASPVNGFKYLVKETGDHTTEDDKRGFSEIEAKLILKAARRETDPVRRWVPLIACWTGARVGEIVGSKASAIRRCVGSAKRAQIDPDGVWCIEIKWATRNPKERIKNKASVRSTPLAQAIIESGFLDYVATLDPDGPLFPTIKAADFDGRRGANASKRMARWVHDDLELTDPLLEPDHSWRHRLENVCGTANIAERTIIAILGHAQPGSKKVYREIPLTEARDALNSLRDPLTESVLDLEAAE
jgi:hypothetical protein